MTIIKKITSVSTEGVSFELTEKAHINSRGMAASKWFVSWDKIGRALFEDQYSTSETVKDLDYDRGHQSDCGMHNEPFMKNTDCTCGANQA